MRMARSGFDDVDCFSLQPDSDEESGGKFIINHSLQVLQNTDWYIAHHFFSISNFTKMKTFLLRIVTYMTYIYIFFFQMIPVQTQNDWM